MEDEKMPEVLMPIVPFLICFPIVVALLMVLIKSHAVRNGIAYVSAVIIMGAVGVLVAQWLAGGRETIQLYYETEMVDHVILAVELCLMVVVTFLCFKHRKYWISLLSILPTLLIVSLEIQGPKL